MSAEALNCPNCGAAVASDSGQCQFCKTRLKTVGCRSCYGLMFIGTQFCGHCGAIAAPIELTDDESGDCPRCRKPLESLGIGATTLRSCPACDGMWADAQTFETICADHERQAAVLGYLHHRPEHPLPMTKVNYVPCPDCGQLMNRNNFARSSGVIVDLCKAHGIWFDADELPTILEFIRRGGMEIARQRERNEIEQEREKLRDERRRNSLAGIDLEAPDDAGARIFARRLFGLE